MHRPKFSVVIPTRERADTLRYALRSCLDQNYEDYEVVVCDNYSSAATKEVVDSFASSRIVYHRSPTPLCMGDNWNLAYGLTRGQYVTYIGDDDGLMPFAFRELDRLLRTHEVTAIRWDYALYSWPNIARRDLANYLQLSMTRRQSWFDGRLAISDVMSGRLSPVYLPNVYHSLVARDTLEEVRSRTGRVFGSFHCDTYSSFTVGYLVGRYLSVSVPMSVSGFSGASNNIAFGFMRGKHANTRTHRAENAASGLRMNPIVPDLSTGLAVIADSFLNAKRDLFPGDSSLNIDRKYLASALLAKMPIDDLSEWPDVVDEMRRSMSDDPELLAWFDEQERRAERKVPPLETYRGPEEGVHHGYLHLDTSKYRVDDVAAAARLSKRILGIGAAPIVWDQRPTNRLSRFERFKRDARLAFTLALHRRLAGAPATQA